LDRTARLAGLLDPHGGSLRVGPVRSGTGARRRLPPGAQVYRSGTNVVETDQDGGGGRVRVVDCLPWLGPSEPVPGRIVRLVRALSGPVEVEIELAPGGWDGRQPPVESWSEGVVSGHTVVRTGLPMVPVELGRDRVVWRASSPLAVGEQLVVTVDVLDDERHRPLSTDAAADLVARTATAWRSWLAPLAYDGPFRGPVERSLLVCRALTWREGGAPAAAATTSLARRPGGEPTEDLRAVRWREAAAATGALARLGFAEDAERAEGWLRRSAEGTSLPWPAMLAVDSGRVAETEETPLAGWRHSQPVVSGRSGGRVDLDLYGDVALAISASQVLPGRDRRGPALGDGPLLGAFDALAAAADWVGDHWAQPDHGLWELARPELLSASRVQSWIFLDRMARLARAANPLDLGAASWQQCAGEILRWLEREAMAADGGLGREPTALDQADAALLRLAWQGPWPPGHPVVARTVDRTIDRLDADQLLYRLAPETDEAGPDHPDLTASAWAARACAALGRWEQGHHRLERLCGLPGPVGLLSESADARSGELTGNLPSVGAHLALVEAALALAAGPI
jgi:GH15 family glucan-1,4-alpha-glucosidase